MKVAIVYSFKPSEWFSCTIINKNLRAAYESIYDEIMYIDYTRKRTVEEEDLKALAESGIEKIIFIDHIPTPVDFLLKLKKFEPECFERLEYTIHVFGDFPLYMPEWRSVFELLEDMPVKFIAASKKQKLFVEKFIPQKDIIFVSPFPVGESEFSYDAKKREGFRTELGLKNETVFLYTGRLTYQKRITDMIEIFCEQLIAGKIARDSYFYIVGGVDTLGVPYLGVSQLLGEYYRQIQKTLAKYSDVSDRVILTGRVENSDLKKYYCMADCYLSLSTYHDEDYGMSVAEALCSGLPAILTNWAGYQSFQLSERPELCRLVDTRLEQDLPQFDREQAKGLLADFKSTFNREEISKLYLENFGVNACAQKLKEIQDTKFESFKGSSPFMKRVTNEQFLRGMEVFKNELNREFNDLYFEAYDVYAQ